MELAERLRHLMLAKNISPNRLAREADIARQDMWLILHGDTLDLRPVTARRLGQVLGVGAWYIYHDNSPEIEWQLEGGDEHGFKSE